MQVKKPHQKSTVCVSVLLFSLLPIASCGAFANGLNGNIVPTSKSNVNNNADPAAGVSDVYSDIDMRLRLAGKSSAAACVADQCTDNLAFNARVGSIGRYLSKAAIQVYPQQEAVIQRMVFSVAEKLEAGTASNNKGQIVVLRGVQYLQLSDDALGFVLAREMSHVLAGHHKTNTSTKLIISVLASVLFPAIAIVGASSAAAQASTSLLTSAASTATSMVGGEVAMAKLKPTQLVQADDMALALMEKAEWDMRSAQSVLMQDALSKSAWMLDLEVSRLQLAKLVDAEDAQITPLVGDFNLEQISDQALNDVPAGEPTEALAEQTRQTQMQTNEELERLEASERVDDILLESGTSSDVETDGVVITPLPASIDACSKASL